ncbi:MAG: NAD(P)-dependent oxidoreductase [Rhodospirillaceae bacterium]|nr:NAD(P)-dependent oxidoreductase [Rhodospirillaceae bacterium]
MSTSPMTKRVGIVGMGLMGQAFIANLQRAQFSVQGYDPDSDRMDQLRDQGGEAVATPADVAKGVDCVIASLPTADIAREALLGAGGIAEGAAEGLYVCDTTTARPEISEQTFKDLADKGIRYLDSEISGTSAMAHERDTIVIAGGREEDFEACKPVFEAIARAAYYMGPAGSGSRTKLVINLVLSGNRLALAEGLVMGEKAGLETTNLLEVLKDGASYSKTMNDKGPKVLSGNYTADSFVRSSLKDARLMLEMGQKVGAPTLMIGTWAQLLQAACEKGLSEKDTMVFFEVLRSMAGLEDRDI